MSNSEKLRTVQKTRSPYDLSVIIVNYNAAEFLVGCLNSIHIQFNYTFEVIVVENASHDNSQSILRNEFPYVKMIANESHVGFSRVNNKVLHICKSSYSRQINKFAASFMFLYRKHKILLPQKTHMAFWEDAINNYPKYSNYLVSFLSCA